MCSSVIPDNPSACINAYAIASKVVKNSAIVTPITLDGIKETLKECADFVDSLSDNRSIETKQELITVEMVCSFFEHLATEGDNEIYVSGARYFRD